MWTPSQDYGGKGSVVVTYYGPCHLKVDIHFWGPTAENHWNLFSVAADRLQDQTASPVTADGLISWILCEVWDWGSSPKATVLSVEMRGWAAKVCRVTSVPRSFLAQREVPTAGLNLWSRSSDAKRWIGEMPTLKQVTGDKMAGGCFAFWFLNCWKLFFCGAKNVVKADETAQHWKCLSGVFSSIL